jgi:hypothetical protein
MHQMCISTTDAQVEKVGNPKKKKMWKLKEPSDENQTEWHDIEPNPSKDRAMPGGDNPSFWRFDYKRLRKYCQIVSPREDLG